jgi:Ca-activated chloride channel homolog
MKRRIFPLLLALLLAATSLLLARAATAQGPIQPVPTERPFPPPEPLPPPLPPIPWPLDQLKIEYQRVDVTIAGQVATTRIEQLFVNAGDRLAEGTYLFPLPEGAVVSELTMWVDGQPIEAKILEAPEARAIYDAIVRQLRDPALLEYVGSSAIQANVFPIPARDERRIEIEYNHVLPAENGLIHYAFPQSTHLYSNLPLQSQRIRVALESNEAIRTIYSPSHDVAIVRDGDYRATVSYEANNVTPDNDFDLYYSVSPEQIGLNLLSYQEAGEDGFFLMLVAPTVAVDVAAFPSRDVILVLDTSGSMAGEKMDQAKEAARYIVEHLNAEDRFNIVAFSTGVRSFAPALAPVSSDSRADALDFIDRLEALGGTNISMALLEAFGQADDQRTLTALFLTDGLATEGIVDTPRLLEAVAEAAPAHTRLFAFGVGNDVDTVLLGGLAQNHRGTTTYVRPGERLDEVVSGFYAKISLPVLVDVQLEVDGVRVEQLYPSPLPDLFSGTQLVLTGRYREGGPATVVLSGDVNGQPVRFVYEDVTFQRSSGAAFIPRLWAARAIGHMLQQIRLHGEDAELVQSIVELSIRYGIITPYTSYLIEEDDIFSQTGREAIIEAEMESAARAAAPVSGEAAVDRADTAAGLAAAEAPASFALPAPSGDGQPLVRSAGSKTFVLRSWEGVETWIDTSFGAESQTPQSVAFASEAYFSLLDAAPALGQYLALGSRILLVHEGTAYLVGDEGESEPLPLPAAAPDNATAAPGEQESGEASTPVAAANRAAPICGAALLPLLLAAVIGGRQRRRR